MAVNPINLGRVSNLARGNLISSTVTRTQASLMSVQQQITSGKRMTAPSDDAGDAAVAQSVRKLLETRESYKTNLDAATHQLSAVDTGLGSVTDLLREAQQIASANVGSDVTSEARSAAAKMMDSIYSQLLSEANKSSGGTYLFAGDRSTQPPFVEAAGGVKWVGSSDVLSNVYDEGTSLDFMVDGANVFGALSSRIRGNQDLTPSLSINTRLDDLNGAQGRGVRRGLIEISDGTTKKQIDLGDADTLGDVVDRINASGVGSIVASINAAGTGIDITPGGGDDVTLKEVGGGSTAADLGILQNTAMGAGVAISGAPVSARVTPLTTLASLKNGTGLDPAGLKIINGGKTTTIDLSAATTVEDLLNTINNSDANVKAQINAAGNGIDILNAVQGSQMSIVENGGTTVAGLGVRSFDTSTKLGDLNSGGGLTNVDGTDLKLTDSTGVSFEVDFAGLDTVGDLVNAVNAAALSAGAGVTASIAAGTNGLVLTDTVAGPGALAVANVNNSSAVSELGLDGPIAAGVLAGKDVGPVESKGLFASVIRLRDALRSDDQREITRASELLEEDLGRVIRVRGEVGAKVKEFESRTERLADETVTTRALLSSLEDTDFTDAIVRFQTLQTSLQASMQAAGQTLNLSLMDFLG